MHEKVKGAAQLLIEDRVMQEACFASLHAFGSPVGVNFSGLHAEKYRGRLRDISCASGGCF